MVSRKCAGCGKIKERSELIRIMKTHNSDEIILMPSSKHFGRSLYLCYNKECLKVSLKKKRLNKALKKDIPTSIIQNIENILDT